MSREELKTFKPVKDELVNELYNFRDVHYASAKYPGYEIVHHRHEDGIHGTVYSLWLDGEKVGQSADPADLIDDILEAP